MEKLNYDSILALARVYAPGLEKEVMAIAGRESSYGAAKGAYTPNKDKVIGPLQIMSKQLGADYGNFEKYAIDGMKDPMNPVHSTVAGIRMIADLNNKYKDPDKAALAYFTGSPTPNMKVSDGLTTAKGYIDAVRKFRNDFDVKSGGNVSPSAAPSASIQPSVPSFKPPDVKKSPSISDWIMAGTSTDPALSMQRQMEVAMREQAGMQQLVQNNAMEQYQMVSRDAERQSQMAASQMRSALGNMWDEFDKNGLKIG